MRLVKVCTLFIFGAMSALPVCAQTITQTIGIDAAVQMALENNLSLKEEEITLNGYKRSNAYSWNSISPSLTAGATYSKSVEPGETEIGTSKLYGRISLSITPALYTEIKTAKINYENGKLSYETAVKTVELNVRKAFYKLLYDADNVKLQEQNLESAEKQYRQNLSKYNQGGMSRLDVLSAQVSVENQKPNVLSAKTTLENDMASFKQTLGISQDVNLVLNGTLDDILLIGDISIDDIEAQSATLKALENKLSLAQTAVLASRFNAYGPTITGSYEASRSYRTGSKDGTNGGAISASVSIPLDGILPWSSSAQNVSSAKDEVKSLELQIEDEKTTLRVNTESYLRSIAQSKAAIASLKASADLAKETYDMTLTAYQRGSKDLLSLQTALDGLLEAQVNLKSAAYSLISSILDLENELGIPFGTLSLGKSAAE